MTLLLAATGQTIVLLRGGIDLSIGGMISFGTVIAATRFGDTRSSATFWAVLIVVIGLLVGAGQRACSSRSSAAALPGHARHLVDPHRRRAAHPADRRRRFQAGGWSSAASTFLGLVELGLDPACSSSVLALVPQHAPRHRHPGDRLQRESAYLSGVSLTFVNVATYGLSGLFAASPPST